MYQDTVKTKGREEYKYLVPVSVFPHLFKDIQSFMCLDNNCMADKGFYKVSSIYFENHSLRSYFDKLDGLPKRAKFRVRFYPEGDKKINLELKCKVYDKCIKRKVSVQPSLLENLFENEPLEDTNDPLLDEFMKIKKANCFFPFIRIDYKRRAFQLSSDKNIRVTFDHSIKCCRFENDLSIKPRIPVVRPSVAIMEVKTQGYFPFWLTQIIKKYSLKRTSISKYLVAVQNLAVNSSLCVR